ncbi:MULTISPECIES: CHAD domain-containing protein [unclassified Caballeronia]|uniref:CHAD domain-containing protein n=1 Tax=unclassified Caballeronia TaxID=2646786 RepID=UPI0028544035|nr:MULTISPECIES: CHAD domain-containing protein [unclassified Caballeronia]MDR5754805.1 CHAD domain-containing protein [Caballeronia sp. LZ024]MDR5839694.1 CHAD domain-containing protein [Caballeronia sp. LZ031]
MTAWVELALVASQKTFDELAEALEAGPPFKGVEVERLAVVAQELETHAPGWCLSVEQHADARTLHAVEIVQAGLPGVTRCRKFARPMGDDAGVSLSELVASGDAPSALQHVERVLSPTRESRRMQWRADSRVGAVLAVLAAQDGERTTLTLAAPADAADALGAVFDVARAAVDAAPFHLLADANDANDADTSGAPVVHASKVDVPRRSTTREAFVAIAASIASHWFGNEAGALRSLDVERVHQLRVAQRRLKTLLKLFPDCVDAAWDETIAPELDWFGDLLADARDWDVFTDTTLGAWAAADAQGAPSWRNAIDAADAKRMAARGRLDAALHSTRYARLTLAFVEWLARLEAHGGHGGHDSGVDLAKYAKKRIRKHYRKIADVADLTTLDAHARHRVRIHAKRLRYALEFLRSLATGRTRKIVARRLSRLQSVLGEANDAAVAADRLAALPSANDYQRGFARAWAAVSEAKDAAEGERILRSIDAPRLKSPD